VLEDQHVGDADIEGKLKKLVAQVAKEKTAARETKVRPVSRMGEPHRKSEGR
jgi:hypothetical protein